MATINVTNDMHRAPASPKAAFALWNLGFRPFYLGGSVFAALSVVLWTAEYGGLMHGVLGGPHAHAHEMLYGFVLAIMTGFLLTAVRNWTGLPTPTGGLLAGLFALWVAGRAAMLSPFPLASVLVNAAFPLAVAVAIAIPLARAGNGRNFVFVVLLALLAAAELAFQAASRGLAAWAPQLTLQVGLDIVLLVIVVIGGRVVPMFTNNAIPAAGSSRRAWVERAAIGATAVVLAADVAGFDGGIRVAVGLAAIAHAARLALWRPWRTTRHPLVWILHAGYGWIVVHLALRFAAGLDLAPGTLALHALTVGTIGSMTIGMMTRTARGHTGRPLIAERAELAMFTLMQLAALARVVGGAAAPAAYLGTVAAAAGCWFGAFALYAIRYGPMLVAPRVDGRPG